MGNNKFRNHQEIISKLEKDLADLKVLGDNYVRLMGKDDPSLATRIEALKNHFDLLKKYQDKFLNLMSKSDVELRTVNCNERFNLSDYDDLKDIKDTKIIEKIHKRTWNESEYWGSVFVSVKDDYTALKQETKKSKSNIIDEILNNDDAAEAYFAAAIYDPAFSPEEENLYLKRKKSIAKSNFNLNEHYNLNGNLDNISNEIIDEDSKRILEMVFSKGLDKTKEILMNAKQTKTENDNVDVAVEDEINDDESDIIEINLNDFEKLEVLSEFDLFALNLNRNIKVTVINIDYDNLEATGINYRGKNESKQFKIIVTE